MPPIRTARRNVLEESENARLSAFGFTKVSKQEAISKSEPASSSPTPPSAVAPTTKPQPQPQPKKKLLKPVCQGQPRAYFQDSRCDWNDKYHKVIGYTTTSIHFGYQFKLNDDHIDEILALGPRVTKNIRVFEFEYSDVSYTAHNSNNITCKAAIRLAKACPDLREVHLQESGVENDAVLLAFFAHCPKLHTLEITGGRHITGSVFDQLAAHPELAPRLKVMRLTSDTDKGFMRSMKALTKARPRMKVVLQSQNERKKWGDWELETYHTTYKKGREHIERPRYEEWGPYY